MAHFVPRDFKGVGFDMIQMDWTNLELFCLQGELRDGILQAHVRSCEWRKQGTVRTAARRHARCTSWLPAGCHTRSSVFLTSAHQLFLRRTRY